MIDNSPSYEFRSFEEALAACGGQGYAQKEIADVVYQKTLIYRLQLSAEGFPSLNANQVRQILPIALAASRDRISVLDLGGGCGVHYFLVRKIFGSELSFRWDVVETPAMVEKAKSLESDELRFFSSLDAACEDHVEFDLAFSSGALQYFPDPYLALESLMQVGAKNLFLTRVALALDGRDHYFIHESELSRHGRGGPLQSSPDIRTRCPTVAASKMRFEEYLSRTYEIVMAFNESVAAYKVGDNQFNQYGYFCRARDLALSVP